MNSARRFFLPLILAALLCGLPTLCRAAAADTPANATVEKTANHTVAEAPEQDTLLKGPSESLITALTTLVIFVVLVAVLGKTAWGPIVAGLKAREDKIRGDIAAAENARKQAEAALAQYNASIAGTDEKIRQMLATAAGDAEKLSTNIRMKAQAEAEEIKERATSDIQAEKDAALRELREQTAELATMVAEKIIRRNLNAADQQDLVRQSLEQLQAV